MTMRDLVVIAAVAAFSLAGIASVNDSEAINVTLPSQYRTVWDQSLDVPGLAEAQVARPPGRLRIEASKWGGNGRRRPLCPQCLPARCRPRLMAPAADAA